MNTMILAVIAFVAYVSATMVQGRRLLVVEGVHPRRPGTVFYLAAIVAVLIHAYLLYLWIDRGGGQHLSFFNMLSIAAWLIAVLVLAFARSKSFCVTSMIVFPLAALSISLVLAFPNQQLFAPELSTGQAVHVLLSILAFSIFGITALQALLLALMEYILKRKQGLAYIMRLPPLESVERLLFQMMSVGFGVLTIVIISSFWIFGNPLQKALLSKFFVACAAWLIFFVLLLGRYRFGWRGRPAIRWTLAGYVLLIVTYFSGNILLGLMEP